MNILTAVITSFQAALALLFEFVPRLVGFLVIVLIGWLVSSAIARGVTFLLRKVGFDRVGDRIGLTRVLAQSNIKTDAADVLGKLVYWFLFLIFLVPAVNALGLTAVSDLLGRVVGYLPNVFVAILILFLGTLAATLVADIVRGAAASTRIGSPNLFSNLARYAILGFVVLVALEQLGIATSLLNILFTAIVGSAALAAALAFGLGGQDAARRYLARTESSLGQAATQVQMQQEQGRTLPSSSHPTQGRQQTQYNPYQ
jgi:small-conductance mechanosensitive channel